MVCLHRERSHIDHDLCYSDKCLFLSRQIPSLVGNVGSELVKCQGDEPRELTPVIAERVSRSRQSLVHTFSLTHKTEPFPFTKDGGGLTKSKH